MVKSSRYAGMAELADAPDLGSGGKPCGFESHYPYQKDRIKILFCQKTPQPCGFQGCFGSYRNSLEIFLHLSFKSKLTGVELSTPSEISHCGNGSVQIRVSPPDVQVTFDAIGGNADGIGLCGLFEGQNFSKNSIDAKGFFARSPGFELKFEQVLDERSG